MSLHSASSAGLDADPLDDTQQNPELPGLLAMRAAHALNHLDPRLARRVDVDAERKATRAALLYAVIVLAVVAATLLVAAPRAGA